VSIIREAVAADAGAVAAIHLRSWQTAYRGILPDHYIDGALSDDLLVQWHTSFADRRQGLVLLAEEATRLVGFIAVWRDRGAEEPALIDNLHVDPARRGGGLGRRLLGEAMRRLAAARCRGAYLWVFAANERTIALYDRLGGVAGERTTKPVGGHPVAMIRYEWCDLAALAARCGLPAQG
jgi:ribosomal protein S18 acetylase RimI-like enzyme